MFAEGLRSAFGNQFIDGLPLGERVTASFGVVEMRTGESFSELYSRADAALYKAKSDGRNRVTCEQNDPVKLRVVA